MKVIVKIFYVLGVAFWSIALILSISKLAALNGLGNFFEMRIAQKVVTDINKDSLDVNISYSYQINDKEYHDNYKMFVEYYERCNVDTIIIKYNSLFPMVSYIDGISLKNRKQKTGIIISLFFLLFLILVWKLSNRDKWVKTYEEIGNRPWLYTNDKTIKNPWKRFLNRLFKK